jgi:hypothetical protein
VNYLSHFIVDHHPGDPYFNTALILPDISKRWIKTFKHPEPSSHFTPEQLSLHQGCLRHYERDKQFHSSTFFEQYQHIVSEAINHVSFSGEVNRKWFIAHILTELLIDRVFVKYNQRLVDLFYESLLSIDDHQLSDFLYYYGIVNADDFFDFFNRFREVKYIYYYADTNKFLYSLGRIMMRVGLPAFNDADTEKMAILIEQLETTYMKDGEVLMDELTNVFK